MGLDLDQVVILENALNAVQTSPNATLPFCSAPDSTVENGISLYSCLWGLTWHGLIGGQHEVEVEIVSCVQKLKLTRHECCFPPAQSL